MAANTGNDIPWFLKTSYPVLFPSHEALNKPRDDFDAFIRDDLARRHDAVEPAQAPQPTKAATEASESFTEVTPSTTADIRGGVQAMDVDETKPEPPDTSEDQGSAGHPFMEGLLGHDKPEEPPNMENKMLTENADVAYQSTTNPLVDLFTELEDVITPPRLRELLGAAWNNDPLSTLKIIFNARSIHLGKSSRHVFYHCAGWLAQNHPLTLVANLRWLSRPVIPKKEKKDETEDDVVLVEVDKDENDPSKHDVKHGVAHGYWKDLLNILALAANGKLDCLSDPRDVLNSENPDIIRGKSVHSRVQKAKGRSSARRRGTAPGRRGGSTASSTSASRGGGASTTAAASQKKQPISAPSKFDILSGIPEDEPETESKEPSDEDELEQNEAVPDKTKVAEQANGREYHKPVLTCKEKRRETREERHRAAAEAFNTNHVYRALHLTVARLFAEQLETDVKALRGDDPKSRRNISLCAKWAPSHDHFHDRHTFVISSIAEIMYPRESFDGVLLPTDNRETYLRHAREQYRKDTSALRKHLEIVERDITTETFGNIKYDRVPSVAMKNYSKLFAEKDFYGFEKYIDRVAEGKANISGATLLPSTMVKAATAHGNIYGVTEEQKRRMNAKALVEHKQQQLQAQVVDGQWNTLVQRIKDSGTLSSAIAVCDVSGSMNSPKFKDGTSPMDSSVGLSLLVASATAPPFGGAFITFSGKPTVEPIDLSKPFTEQVRQLRSAHWGANTNFVDVFDKLILPMAKKNRLKPEDMVKRVFVFSDMQFDSAEGVPSTFSNSSSYFGRWSTSFERIKGRFEDAGYEMPELVFWNLAGGRSGMASKPVTTTDEGTSLVSGYSQGMLKVFLDSGGFEEPGAEDDGVVVTKDEDADVTTQPAAKKAKMDPLRTVKKAIGHKSYDMLEVLD